MTLKTLAAAACLIAVSATASLAATFTVNGTDFDVTTIEGTFSNNQSLLESQVWWGDRQLALDFALEVADSFGFPNIYGDGPLFAYRTGFDSNSNPTAFAATFTTFFLPAGSLATAFPTLGNAMGDSRIFAIATEVSAVPLPAGGLLLISGFGGLAAFQRRKKRSA